ncbi:MAG: transcriptional regulator [Neobacillus sp.]|jgi:anionic cell wall polymer biosynthesis LytR-Cps2A-Psr (LCP) family protein|nr:transcriptional regulator [Neobacillus sp.]
MKRLILAVIVFSFLGFGPLSSFFHSESPSDKGETKGVHRTEDKIKESSFVNKGLHTFLVMEKEKSTPSAMLIKYDTNHDKIMVGSILLPNDVLADQRMMPDELMAVVEDRYNLDIDHCFTFNPEGLADIIDSIAPNGIEVNSNQGQKLIYGQDFVNKIESLRNHSTNADEIFMMVKSLKEEIKNSFTAETIVTMGPALLDEILKSVDTDMGKGRLMEFGLMVMMNPVTTIEPLKLTDDVNKVNLMIKDKQSDVY